MNVSSASLTPASLFAKDPASPNATAAPQKSPLASLLDKPSSISQGSSSGKDSAPGLDVAKKLKALGEQFLAVMLITDPVERARAAKDLYKQYAQTAKEYASATADGRAAAAVATEAFATDPNAALNPNAQDAETAPSTAAGAAAVTDDGAPPPAVADPTDAAKPATTDEPAPTTNPAPAAQPVVYMPGKKSNFVADLYMEQIKTFANAAQQVYQSAVEEARNKHRDKTKMHGFDDEMKAAKEDLTKAAKAVEGPAATADGYDPVAAAIPSYSTAAPSLVNLTV